MLLKERENIIRLKEGSLDAFELLYEQYSGRLYNFVLKLCKGNVYQTEELVQHTFVKIWESRTRIDSNKSFISYLCTIAKNTFLNEMEHQTVQYLYEEYVQSRPYESYHSPEQELDSRILETYIEKLIEKLPEARRRVFMMSRKEMLTNKEIAERLQITESTIQTQLSKAIEFMRRELGKYYEYIIFILFYTIVK